MSAFPGSQPINDGFTYRPGYAPRDEEGKQALRKALHRVDAAVELFKRAVINRAPQAFEYYSPEVPAIGPHIQRTTRDLSESNLPEDVAPHIALAKQLYDALEAAAALYGTKDRRGYKQIVRFHFVDDFKGNIVGFYTEKYADLGDVINVHGEVMTVKNVKVDDQGKTRILECY